MKKTESARHPSGSPLEVKKLWRGMSNIQARRDVQVNFGRQQQAGKEQYQAAYCSVQQYKPKFGTISSIQAVQMTSTVVVAMPIKKMFAFGCLEVEIPTPQSVGAIAARESWSSWSSMGSWVGYGVAQAKQKPVDSFIERAKRLDREGNTDAALDLLYDNVDEMLKASKFQDIDNLIHQENVSTCSVHILLGLLTATLPARTKLKSRPAFFVAAENVLKSRDEWAPDLLVGLDG